MTIWQKDVTARRRMRAAIEDLRATAKARGDCTEGLLHEAHVHAKSRKLWDAQDAAFDLAYAADNCSDTDLKAKIQRVENELRKIVT